MGAGAAGADRRAVSLYEYGIQCRGSKVLQVPCITCSSTAVHAHKVSGVAPGPPCNPPAGLWAVLSRSSNAKIQVPLATSGTSCPSSFPMLSACHGCHAMRSSDHFRILSLPPAGPSIVAQCTGLACGARVLCTTVPSSAHCNHDHQLEPC